MSHGTGARVGLATIVHQWGRIGCIGFGGPPTHIALLRSLCVDQRGWLSTASSKTGSPPPTCCQDRHRLNSPSIARGGLRRWLGAILGGVSFIAPGLIVILALSALLLSAHPPLWVEGAAAGAGVPAVAVWLLGLRRGW